MKIYTTQLGKTGDIIYMHVWNEDRKEELKMKRPTFAFHSSTHCKNFHYNFGWKMSWKWNINNWKKRKKKMIGSPIFCLLSLRIVLSV